MRSDSHRNQEIERTTISMCQRQKTEFAFPPVQYAKLDAVHHIPRQVVSGKHNPFTETGRAGSIVQQDHFVIVQFRIFDIILFEECQIRRGDKIALIGKDSARWCIVYMAAVTYGAIIVPILQDFSPNDVHHIINHSESVFLFVSDRI